MNNWREQFDKEFHNDSFYLLHEEDQAIKSFIQQLLEDQKRELLEKITLEKKEQTRFKSWTEKGCSDCEVPEGAFHKGDCSVLYAAHYHKAVTDLNAIKVTLETPIEGKDENPPEPEGENYGPEFGH
jgi:hypothetical protein